MLQIAPRKIPQWRLEGDFHVPASVDITCGFCHSPTTLITHSCVFHTWTATMMMMGRCVRCNQESKIWAIGVKGKNSNSGMRCDDIWVLPKPATRELVFSSEKLPFEIFDAYEEAVGCFNDGRWRATVTECGRALEGITQDKFTTQEQRKQLKDLSGKKLVPDEDVQRILFNPILELSSAIRLGRLTGAHFNLKGKADREVAEKVLDLTEYLIRYFYILSIAATELEVKINTLGDKGLSEDE